MRLILTLAAAIGLAAPASAQEAGGALKSLQTGDDSRGWDAVGRLNLGHKGFCTGALIADNLVLTTGHCLFDKETGARIPVEQMEFLAGWRNGRAAAYRGVRRALAHPDFVYSGAEQVDRVTHDLALLELDQPIRLPSIIPFETDVQPMEGDDVGVVSYAKDRAEAPSLQEMCKVLGQKPEMLILSCAVDFGASGSPIFSLRGGVARVVSVVSAKADLEGKQVALGTSLLQPLVELRAEMAGTDGVTAGHRPAVRTLSGGGGGGAKFVRPAAP